MQHIPTPVKSGGPVPVPFGRIAVLGGGSWGTAIAAIARRAGREVTIWARDPETAHGITLKSRNERYLPGIDLPEGMRGTTNIAEAVGGAEAVFLVVPSGAIRSVCGQMRDHLGANVPVVVCAKGIEPATGFLMSNIVEEELPEHPVGALSGPTFAAEAARGDYTAATLAFRFDAIDRLNPAESPAARLAVSIGSASFRPYISDDLVGVEVAGAMKNVIAIACGIMAGQGYAENTRAALIARGMEEMKTVATALGGRRATVTGLAGAGDLTLTCSSRTSRNMNLGFQLGQGLSRDDCFEGRPVVVEGERNAASVHDLAQRLDLKLPICETVHAVLYEGATPAEAFAAYWSSPIEAEPFEMDIQFPHPIAGDVTA